VSADHPTTPRLYFDAPAPVASAASARTHLVAGVARAALDTLVEGFASAEHLGTLAGVEAPPESPGPDLVLERLPFGEDAVRELRQVSEDLLRHLLGAQDALSAEALGERTDALRGAVRRALEEAGRSVDALVRRAERDRLLGEVGKLLREVGLERLDVDVALVPLRGGEAHLVSEPQSQTAAHVRLLDRLLGRLEVSLLGHELLALEREASSWWFHRWSAEPTTPEGAVARRVREREWSLAERGTLYMGPVVDSFLARGLGSRLPPRQKRLAQALQASFPGVFVVRDRRDGSAIFQEMGSGRRIEVQEHDAAAPYRAGWIGLGRLYAFDGPVHLRSPGMALIESDEDALAERLSEAFRRGRRQLAPAVALETLVSALTGESALPRPVPPARSPADARQRVDRATHALTAAGMVEDSDEPPDGAPDPSSAEPRATRRYKVDQTMGQWLSELFDLARQTRRPGPARARAGARRGKRRG
jgi:hypothetical protein